LGWVWRGRAKAARGVTRGGVGRCGGSLLLRVWRPHLGFGGVCWVGHDCGVRCVWSDGGSGGGLLGAVSWFGGPLSLGWGVLLVGGGVVWQEAWRFGGSGVLTGGAWRVCECVVVRVGWGVHAVLRV